MDYLNDSENKKKAWRILGVVAVIIIVVFVVSIILKVFIVPTLIGVIIVVCVIAFVAHRVYKRRQSGHDIEAGRT